MQATWGFSVHGLDNKVLHPPLNSRLLTVMSSLSTETAQDLGVHEPEAGSESQAGDGAVTTASMDSDAKVSRSGLPAEVVAAINKLEAGSDSLDYVNTVASFLKAKRTTSESHDGTACPVDACGACPKEENPRVFYEDALYRYRFCKSCGAYIDPLNPTPCPHGGWLSGFGHVPGGRPMPGQLEEIKVKEEQRLATGAHKFREALAADIKAVTEPATNDLLQRVAALEARVAALEQGK